MASTYLSRTNGTPTDVQKYTFSAWVKRAGLGARQRIVTGVNPSSTGEYSFIEFTAADLLGVNNYDGTSGSGIEKATNRVFRDTSAWYHIVVAVDSTQATATDRLKIYVNGVQETSFNYENSGVQYQDLSLIKSGKNVYVGQHGTVGMYFNGEMAHVHLIDGTVYDASAFGQINSASGIWVPKISPSVTYGTNGFFLDFANSSDLGNDVSGNNNDLTLSGSGTQTLDTPSNVFATLNPLAFENAGSSVQMKNGNLRWDGGSSGAHNLSIGTLAVSQGKYYAEFKLGAVGGSYPQVGIRSVDVNNTLAEYVGQITGGVGFSSNGTIAVDGSNVSTGLTTYTTGDIIGVGLDLDGNKIYFYKNGTLVNTGGTSITNRTYTFAVSQYQNTGHWLINFGNGYFGTTPVSTPESDSAGLGKFEYSVPSGYYALCTKNIAEYG